MQNNALQAGAPVGGAMTDEQITTMIATVSVRFVFPMTVEIPIRVSGVCCVQSSLRSSQTPVYDLNAVLYGLHQLRDDSDWSNEVYVFHV